MIAQSCGEWVGVGTRFRSEEIHVRKERRKQSSPIHYKKNGWDCLRHYEILANGSIPLFIKLDDCPNNTLTSFPKKELLKFYNLYNNILNYYNPLKIYKKRFRNISKFYYYGKFFFKKLPSPDSFIKKNQDINQIRNYLLEYTKKNLTSEKLADYVINTSNTFFK